MFQIKILFAVFGISQLKPSGSTYIITRLPLTEAVICEIQVETEDLTMLFDEPPMFKMALNKIKNVNQGKQRKFYGLSQG